jgi:hypothetical protein
MAKRKKVKHAKSKRKKVARKAKRVPSPSRKHRPKRKAAVRRNKPRARKPAKRSRPIQRRGKKTSRPVRKASKKSQRASARKAASRRLARLEEENRKLRDVVRDLTRSPTERARTPNMMREQPLAPFNPPEGAIITERNSRGEPEAFELPDYTGDTFEDTDFGDWDTILEDVGDEDDDQYGEDSTT